MVPNGRRNGNRRFKSLGQVGLASLLGLGGLPAGLAVALPIANATGDYPQRTDHRFWVVVDPDPEGVNCRWSAAMPEQWYDPRAQFPQMDIDNWPVVKTYQRNQALLANLAPAGFAMLADDRGKPWLKVVIGAPEQICLIRANGRFIRPYERN